MLTEGEKVFTFTEVHAEAERIASEFPGHTSPMFVVGEHPDGSKKEGCRYLDPEDCPSCYIGVLLSRLGFSTERLASLDTAHEGGGCTPGCSKVGCPGGQFWLENFTVDARLLMTYAQTMQDKGSFWPDALRFARDHMNTVAA